jgi:cytidylate kinase
MSIITISRGSYSLGLEVADKVARHLGYDCISREVLLEISNEFNIPEIKLNHAIRDAPRFLERYTFGRERYIHYIRAAILKRLSKDNIVYHGLAGHFFVREVPHVLKVRIIADMKYRIEYIMKLDGVSMEKAEKKVLKLDEERRKWSRKLYGIDTWDPRLYNLVINIDKISVDHAVELICHAVRLEPFRTTVESQKQMDYLVRSATEELKKETLAPFLEPMRGAPWRRK